MSPSQFQQALAEAFVRVQRSRRPDLVWTAESLKKESRLDDGSQVLDPTKSDGLPST